MPPPPAEPFAARVFLGPALRAQPDRRLVKLVREGYEAAFEEIVRRYRRPLDRFAAAIVGGRSEDVTQDAFSKALLALRGTTAEIELRPWLYRIVRNTALNELRDGPVATEELGEAIAGGRSAAEEVESREEIGELMERLRALPEPQRAAIVMRELEGLSHEEIAAALGVSGGAARQAIYRARLALRDGVGLLIPLPLLRVLFDHGAEAAGAGAGGIAAAGAAGVAGGGTGATLGGLSAAGALKVGLATAVLAGSVGAGVAIQHDRGGRDAQARAEAAAARPGGKRPDAEAASYQAPRRPDQALPVDSATSRGRGGSGSADDHSSDAGGGRSGRGGGIAADDDFVHDGPSPSGPSGNGDRSSGDSEDHPGEEISGGSQSGRHGSESESRGDSGGAGRGGGSGESGGGDSHGSTGGSDSNRGGSGSSDGLVAPATGPAPLLEPPPTNSGDPTESGSGSGGSGTGGDSGTSSSGSGSDNS